MQYDIRYEFLESKYKDVKVSGSSINQVRDTAEALMGNEHKYQWRGLVVFVDHNPPCSIN